MSEILTAEQVAELFANQMNTQCCVYFEVVSQSHEALRANYDALLQGATAQRVATLMDDADRAQVEIERLKEDNWRLEKERNIAQVLRNDTWVELAALRARIAELEKERDAALELAARREKENRLILRLHKRKQGISDDALQHSIAERDGLRGAIGAAPHEDHCGSGRSHFRVGDSCNCWKSRALAAVPAPTVKESLTVQTACSMCGGPAEFIEAEGVYRHKGNPGDNRYAAQTLCDKYGYPIQVVASGIAAVPASPPESPLISTLRYLISLDLPKAELLDRLVKAVRDANTTVDGRALTAAEMRHEGDGL